MSGTPQNSKLRKFLTTASSRTTRSSGRPVPEAAITVVPEPKGAQDLEGEGVEEIQHNPPPPITDDSSSESEPEDLLLPHLPRPMAAPGPQIKIQTFAGRPGENGVAWLQRYASQCTHLYRYDEDQIKATFPYYLTGQAEAWYNSLTAPQRDDPVGVEEAFKKRFDGKDYGFSHQNLRQRPGEVISDYTTRFLQATNNRDMPQEWLVSLYVDGLQPSVRLIVKPQHLQTLEEARKASVRAEQSLADYTEVSEVHLQQPSQTNPMERQMGQLLDMMNSLCGRLMDGQSSHQNQHQQNKDGFLLRSVLLVLLLLVGFPCEVSSNELLPRLNYGIVFQKEAQLTLSREYWLHTFEIKLPRHLSFPLIAKCHKDKDTCKLISHVLAQLNSIRIDTGARLNNTLETIHKLVPHADMVTPKSTKGSRSKRALLPFIGRFSRTLFGTATVDDVNILAQHMNALNIKTQEISEALVQHGKHLSSFMAQSNERMDNLLNGIHQNHVAIQYITNQIEKTAKTLQETYDDMTRLLLTQLRVSNTINHELDELKIAVINLANGRLSPLLLPLGTLQNMLNDIQTILATKYTGFFVSVKSAAQMYHDAKFIYTRKQSLLYLTLKVPISYSKDSLNLYKVMSFPVPVNDTAKHATQILDMPDYFAITSDQQFYIHLSQSEMASCKGSVNKHCHMNLPLKPVTKDSCSLGLFSNNKAAIKNLCNIRFIQNAIVPKVTELSANKVLLYASPILSMECNGKHKMARGCNFCIFDLPCQCSLSSDDFYLPQRLIACKQNPDEDITQLHPVNLILLQQFFDDQKFQQIFADSTFASPLNVTTPQFKIYNHAMSKILADDEKSHLNLSKMVEITKNDDIVFQTLAEPILSGHIGIMSDWPNLTDILSLIAIIASATAIVLVILMFCQYRKLAASLLLLKQNSQAKALQTTLPSFIYTQRPQLETNNSFDFNTVLNWEHANLMFLIFNTILLIVLLVNLINRKKAPKLILEVTSLKTCLFIPVMTLPLCPSQAAIDIPENVSEIKLRGTLLFPKLQIDWKDFTINDELTDTKYQVPSIVKLSIWQSFQLRKLLRQPFFINILTAHNGYLSHISLAQV